MEIDKSQPVYLIPMGAKDGVKPTQRLFGGVDFLCCSPPLEGLRNLLVWGGEPHVDDMIANCFELLAGIQRSSNSLAHFGRCIVWQCRFDNCDFSVEPIDARLDLYPDIGVDTQARGQNHING